MTPESDIPLTSDAKNPPPAPEPPERKRPQYRDPDSAHHHTHAQQLAAELLRQYGKSSSRPPNPGHSRFHASWATMCKIWKGEPETAGASEKPEDLKLWGIALKEDPAMEPGELKLVITYTND